MVRPGIGMVALGGVVLATSYLLAQGTPAPGTGPGKTATSEAVSHAFGTKILYVITRPRDSHTEAGSAVYEHAEVTKLGAQTFLVGKVPDWGLDDPLLKITRGTVVWTPLSEVLQITEFDTLEKARAFFEQASASPFEPEAEAPPST